MQAAGGPRGARAPSSRGFLLKALPCSSWGVGAGWGQPRTDFPVPRACGATRQRPPGLRLLLSFAFGAPVCTHSVPTAGLASNSRSETYLPLLQPGITGAEKCDGQTPSEGDDRDRRTRVTEGLRIAPQQQVLRGSAAAADQSHSAQRALSAPASAVAGGLEGRPRGSRSTQTRHGRASSGSGLARLSHVPVGAQLQPGEGTLTCAHTWLCAAAPVRAARVRSGRTEAQTLRRPHILDAH